MIIMNYFLLVALAMTATAAPSTPTQPSVGDVNRARPCTDGPPATLNYSGIYPMDRYTLIAPTTNWTSYSVKKPWFNRHYLSGPVHLDVVPRTGREDSDPGTAPYAAFKFQYICDNFDGCSSYFVWNEANSGDPHCYLFDDVMTPSVFEEYHDTIVTGAYDLRCSSDAEE